MKNATHFVVLAILVGAVQGGTQALSRSLFASLIPRDKSGEFFGFFGVAEKFAGILGPLLFTGESSRSAILAIIAFFAVGGALLYFVDVAEGQRLARAEEGRSRSRVKSSSGSLQSLLPVGDADGPRNAQIEHGVSTRKSRPIAGWMRAHAGFGRVRQLPDEPEEEEGPGNTQQRSPGD